METFSRPPPRGTSDCADPEASWGHRSGGGPGQDSELFFGYYPSAATMMRDEHGPPVPELARRMTVCSCRHDPARALVPVLTAMPETASRSATSSPTPATPTATPEPGPSRSAQSGAQLVQDLHPLDRGPRGTHHGAIIANGNLYCPATPRTLLELAPLARDATPEQAAAHDQQTAETARYKLGRITSDDADGYHRVACPAATGKIRCPLRPASMTLDRQPARDPHPARAPARLLPPADHHRPAGRGRQDPRRNTTTHPKSRRSANSLGGRSRNSAPGPWFRWCSCWPPVVNVVGVIGGAGHRVIGRAAPWAGQARACPCFLPEGPQWSPGSRPAPQGRRRRRCGAALRPEGRPRTLARRVPRPERGSPCEVSGGEAAALWSWRARGCRGGPALAGAAPGTVALAVQQQVVAGVEDPVQDGLADDRVGEQRVPVRG